MTQSKVSIHLQARRLALLLSAGIALAATGHVYAEDKQFCVRAIMGQPANCFKVSAPAGPAQSTQAAPASTGGLSLGNFAARQRAYSQCISQHQVGMKMSMQDLQMCQRVLLGTAGR